MVLPRKVALEYDLSCTIRKDSISFSRKYDLTLKTEMKDHLFQKIHGNMIFSVYSVKMVFFFLQIWYYPSVKRAKIIFSRKIHLKMTLLVSLRTHRIIRIRRTSVINVNYTSKKFVIINLICKNLRSTISIFTPFFKVTFICYRRNWYYSCFTTYLWFPSRSQTRNFLQV